jgi:hypothetical protein
MGTCRDFFFGEIVFWQKPRILPNNQPDLKARLSMVDSWKPSRRSDVRQMTPAELFIRAAVAEVEAVGADPRLTDAVELLQAAKDAVADYVDGVEKRRFVRVVERDEV